MIAPCHPMTCSDMQTCAMDAIHAHVYACPVKHVPNLCLLQYVPVCAGLSCAATMWDGKNMKK